MPNNNLSGYYGLKIKTFNWCVTGLRNNDDEVNAFLEEHDGRIHSIQISCTDGYIVITIIYEE